MGYTEPAIDKKFDIIITNEAINQKVSFKPFIESFADNFTIKATPTEVYGRMDPIQSYQNTVRSIQLSFAVPAVSIEEAISNLGKIQTLIRFQYPIYNNTEEDESIQGILSPPLCSMMLSNFTKFNSSSGKLYGYFSNVNYVPDYSQNTTLFFKNGNIYPQLYKVTLQMNVIHVDSLGWAKKQKGGYVWRGDKKDESTAKNDENEIINLAAQDKVTGNV